MELCPCGSELLYAQCCEPLIEENVAAKSPEQLMRSRYTAFAKNKLDHLLETTIPSARDEHDADSARQWSEDSIWESLEIIRAEGGEDDTEGVVEFIAQFSQNGAQFKHHELAIFAKENGRWFFVDGEQVIPKPFTREAPKTGRNAPCPCNSGKKFKKCCGK